MVLLWNLLVNLSFATTLLLFSGRFAGYFSSSPLYVSILIAIVLVCSLVISAPLSGWLADAKLGNLKVHKIGIFLTTLVTCVLMLTTELSFQFSVSLLAYLY